MDGYSYIDIFETKGIEYLVIIAFLLLLIPFSILIDKKLRFRMEVLKSFSILSKNVLNIPQGLFYSKHHTWAHLEKTGLAKVGLDHLMTGFAGEMRINPLRYSNEMIRKGDVMAEIGLNGKRLRVHSPISGQIIKSNPVLETDLLADSHSSSNHTWIYEIKPLNWKDETSSYYLAEEASAWFKAELERLKDFLAVKASQHALQPSMVVLQDGGELRENMLNELPAEAWQDFQQEFLNPEESIDQSI